jgi:hypothetical protein
VTFEPRLLAALCLASTLTLLPFSSYAQETNYEKALAEITKTAERICQSAPLEQTSEGLSLTGDAQAKLGGVVGKIADLGVSGGAKYETGKSLGVLQKDLIQALQIGNNCKLEVFRVLERDLIQNRQSTLTETPPQVKKSKNDEHYVNMGPSNWTKFPVDVQNARGDCLERLFRYGNHPENFHVTKSSPDKWSDFVGFIWMHLSRDPKTLELISVDFRITSRISDSDQSADESKLFRFTCQFRNGTVISSSFF